MKLETPSIIKDPPEFVDSETATSLPPPSKDGLRIIRYFVKEPDKYPLTTKFERYWRELLKRDPEEEIRDLEKKKWIRTGRIPGKGKCYSLINMDYAVKYVRYCEVNGIILTILPHHSEYHPNGGLYRQKY